MKKRLGFIERAFPIAGIGRALLLDEKWPGQTTHNDSVDIIVKSGVSMRAKVRDIVSYNPDPGDDNTRRVSLLVHDSGLGPNDQLVGAEVFLAPVESK